MTNGAGDRPTTTTIPRWEWRTFGDIAAAAPVLDGLDATVEESDETYVLSLTGDASVKVRGGLLDVKVLRNVRADGLQLWTPIIKAPFPVDRETAASALAALDIPLPPLSRDSYTLEEWLEGPVAASPHARAVGIHKHRERSILDGCMVERTRMTSAGETVATVTVESPDAALVIGTVRRLGFADVPNTCCALGLKELVGWLPSRRAVIDVGTNSVKFHLDERAANGAVTTVVDTASVTRLGEGLADAGRLIPIAIDRTVAAIAAMVDDARREPARIVAVGTAGLRQAPNRQELVDAVFARTGVAVAVISGAEEARLAYRAAVATLPVTGPRLMVFDSGGGSSQFTFGSPDRIDEQFSLDIGAVRITETYGLAHAVPRETVDAALAGIAHEFARVAGRDRPDAIVAIGGTSTNLAAVAHALATYDPDVVHGTVLDVAEIDRQIEAYRRLDADERRDIVGLQPARAEVILAGACIVRTILAVTGQDRVIVSDRGLRHGVAAERFGV